MTKKVENQLYQIDDDLGQLLKKLKNHSNEELNRVPAPGQWSALQIMQHLMLAEELSVKYVRKKLSFKPALKRTGFGAAWSSFLLKIYLSLPFKFNAPGRVGDEQLPAVSEFAEVSQKWLSQRKELGTYLESLPDDLFAKEIYKHPFGGRLSLSGMITFFKSHFDRHEKQIGRTLRS